MTEPGGLDFGVSDEDLQRRRLQAAGLAEAMPNSAAGESEEQRAVRRSRQLVELARRKQRSGDYPAAIAAASEASERDRANAEAFIVIAECYIALKRFDRTGGFLDCAERATTDPAIRTHIAQLREECRRAPILRLQEQARRRLRARDYKNAAALLDRCLGQLDDPDVAIQRSYAYERMSAASESAQQRPSRPPSGVRWLDPGERQRVIRWLTQEELLAAEKALAEARFDATVQACKRAAAIASGGSHATMLHARALAALAIEVWQKDHPDFDRVHSLLVMASGLATHAAKDPSLSADCRALAADVDKLLADVDRIRRDSDHSAAISEVLRRYNALVDYRNKSLRITDIELANDRATFAYLAAKVETLRKKVPAATPNGRLLAELAEAIAARLQWASRWL